MLENPMAQAQEPGIRREGASEQLHEDQGPGPRWSTVGPAGPRAGAAFMAAASPEPRTLGPSCEPTPEKSHPHVNNSEGGMAAWRACWGDSKAGRAQSLSVSINFGSGAFAVNAALGKTLGNRKAGGLSSLSAHISLLEPRIQCTWKENEAPMPAPAPRAPPPPEAQPCPLHLPWAVITGTCSCT